MDKIKPKTAIGRFIDQLPNSAEQLLLNPKKEGRAEGDRLGESLIFELPSGKKVKFVPKLVNPKRCKIWKGNIRLQEFLNQENTKDLREKINTQGQLVPVLARPIKNEPEYSHEIIYGSRRHYVCSSLGKSIKILEADLDDNDALVFMDAENSGREDISPYETALAYKFWIDNGIFKNQVELSQQLGITRSWLNKIISLTRIPKEIISAISEPKKLSLKCGLELVKILMEDPSNSQGLIEKSVELCQKGLDSEDILKNLLNYKEKKLSTLKTFNKITSKIIHSNEGNPLYKIISSEHGRTTLVFDSKLSKQKVLNMLDQIETLVKKLDVQESELK